MLRRSADEGDAGRAVVRIGQSDGPLPRGREMLGERDEERTVRLHGLAARLDLPMTALGVIFLLVVLGQTVATAPQLQRALAVVGWLLWAVFVAEFLLRLAIAPSKVQFLRRYWWQLVFLILPMLRFVRLLFVLRVARAGRVVSSAVRSSRSAGRVLSNRLGWLAVLTVIVILALSQLLYAFGSYPTYADALHAAALAAVAGEPLGRPDGFAKLAEVALAVYSVVVFASLAGALGAYFLEPRLRVTVAAPPDKSGEAGEKRSCQ